MTDVWVLHNDHCEPYVFALLHDAEMFATVRFNEGEYRIERQAVIDEALAAQMIRDEEER